MLHRFEKKLKPVLATIAFLIALIISGFLQGAIEQEGVPLSMVGFITVAFAFLQLCMLLTWLSYIFKWHNILFLALPSSLAVLAMIVIYEGVWREEGLEAERQGTEHAAHEDLAKSSINSWACKGGWKLNQKEESGKITYYLSQSKTSIAPVLIATKPQGADLKTTGGAASIPLDQLKDILKSCIGDGFEDLRQAYFPTIQLQDQNR